MFYNHRIAVIIPAYRVEKWVQKVLAGIPDYIDFIVVVDDHSNDKTSEKVGEVRDPRIHLIQHPGNLGVGGAMKTGFQKAMKLGVDICVKMDGDNQMDPEYLPALLYPLVKNECDYSKGNRFSFFADNGSMPLVRKLGNQILTFFNKFSSGYWHIFDPQNGYLAIRADCLRRLPLRWVDNTYFFENSMLINLNALEIRVSDVYIPSRYGEEQSSMDIFWVLRKFPVKLLKGFFHRIFYRYIYRDFSPVAVMLFLGSLFMLGGMLWGAWGWWRSQVHGIVLSLGSLALGLIPILLGFQLVLTAILQDIQHSVSGKKKLYDFSREDLQSIVEGSSRVS